MRGPAGKMLLVGVGLLLVACTRSTTSPSTTEAAPPVGSTPTTVMPAGQPTLQYFFEPNLLLDFELAEELIEVIEIDGDPDVIDEITRRLGFAESAIELDFEGSTVVLLLDGPGTGYEVVRTRQIDSLDLNGSAFPAEFRRAFEGVDAVPTVVDDRGKTVVGQSGAPAAFLGHPGAFPLPLLGPELPEGPLEDGMTWVFTHMAAVDVEVQATISGIEETDGQTIVTVELEGSRGAIDVDPFAPAAIWPGAEGLLTALGSSTAWMAMERDDLDVAFELEPSTVSGTYRIRLGDGTVVASSTEWEVVQRVTFTMQGETGPKAAVVTSQVLVSTDQALTGRQVVSDAQARRVLRAFEQDSFDLAQEVAEVPGFEIADITEESLGFLASIVPTDGALFVGFGTSSLSAGDGGLSLLTATLGPLFGGEPNVAEAFVSFFLEIPYDQKVVSGQNVIEFSWQDTPVYAWSNNTHVVLMVGDEAVVAPVIEALVRLVGTGDQWAKGDCVDAIESGAIPFAPFGSIQTVHCKSEHSHEVIASIPLPEGPDAEFPEDLSDRVSRTCGEAFLERYGRLAPDSTLGLIRYLPDGNEWAEGDRYLACVVYLPREGGAADRLYGRLLGGPDEFAFEPAVGDCLRTFTELGDCASRHSFEVVGFVTFDDPPGAPYPGAGAVGDYLDDACGTLLDAYGITEGDGRVEAGAFLEVFEWEQGSRTVPCRATVLVEVDGGARSALADIRGSLRDSWTVVGEETSS